MSWSFSYLVPQEEVLEVEEIAVVSADSKWGRERAQSRGARDGWNMVE